MKYLLSFVSENDSMRTIQIATNIKIVTVDDSPFIADRLKCMLSEMSNVEFAGNATHIAEALTLIEEQKPNVVILDIHLEADLPTTNGMNLLILLREKYPELKIIMLTNLIEDQYRNTCMFLGANYFFDKSNEFERIPEVVYEISLSL